jgi:hypothetical protein
VATESTSSLLNLRSCQGVVNLLAITYLLTGVCLDLFSNRKEETELHPGSTWARASVSDLVGAKPLLFLMQRPSNDFADGTDDDTVAFDYPLSCYCTGAPGPLLQLAAGYPRPEASGHDRELCVASCRIVDWQDVSRPFRPLPSGHRRQAARLGDKARALH